MKQSCTKSALHYAITPQPIAPHTALFRRCDCETLSSFYSTAMTTALAVKKDDSLLVLIVLAT